MSDTEGTPVPPNSEKAEKIEEDKDGTGSSSDGESQQNVSQVPEKPPELKKYWEAVRKHPGDFTGWTYLLQYVEQKNIIEFYREAFDQFFNHYPYCYGYWKKYGDTERKHGHADVAYKVYERGVKAIPLCPDLWIHYITFQMQDLIRDEKREEKIRELFERAVEACGLDSRSDKLWEYFIKFEVQHKRLMRVTGIYDRLLNIPTQQLSSHMTKFKELIRSHSPRETLSLDEFLKHRAEYVASKENSDMSTDKDIEVIPGVGAPPGEDGPPGEDVESVNEEQTPNGRGDLPPGADLTPPGEDARAKNELSDEKELEAVKELAVKIREDMFKKTEEELKKRKKFEDQIRRPYFHAKPLEKGQIKNWKEYLDFEIQNGSQERVRVLFERCLIACALYEEMWLKYAKYMETIDKEAASLVYQRACTIHLPKKPLLHLKWAAFEESKGAIDAARKVLSDAEQSMPGLVTITMERINLERRQKKYTKVTTMLKEKVEASEKPDHLTFFASKLSCFLHKVVGDIEAAKEVLRNAVKQKGIKEVLYMKLVDLEYQRTPIDEEQTLAVFREVLEKDLPVETKILFSKRKLEFTRDFCIDVKSFQAALEDHTKLVKSTQSLSKKRRHTDPDPSGGDSGEQKKPKVSSENRTEPPTSSQGNYNQPIGGYAQPQYSQPPYQPPIDQTYNYQQQWPGYQNPYAYHQPQQWNSYTSGYYPS